MELKHANLSLVLPSSAAVRAALEQEGALGRNMFNVLVLSQEAYKDLAMAAMIPVT